MMRNILFLLLLASCTSHSQTVMGRQNVDQFPINAQGTTVTFGLTWLPQTYANTTRRYPLIIAGHGAGETGTTQADLSRLYSSSPRSVSGRIADGWNATAVNPLTGVRDSFIVVSPQAANWFYGYELKYILANIKSRYRVDTTRIYATGLSAGGSGIMSLMGSGDSTVIKQFAAIATASCAGVVPANGLTDVQVEAQLRFITKSYGVQVWTIAGDQDSFLPTDVRYHDSVNKLSPTIPGKLTVISGVGHSAWGRAYDTLYRPTLSYYGNSVNCNNGCASITSPNANGSPVRGSGTSQDSLNTFEWFLRFQRNYTSPTANAGADQVVTLPANSTTLNGTVSAGTGNTIASITWSKVSGPSGGAITSPTTASTGITGLIQGTYVFRLTVVNNLSVTAIDDISIVVNQQVPIAHAGSDQVLTAPTASTTLDGSTSAFSTSFQWTRLSGPNASNIVSPTAAQTVVNNLIVGVYQFQLSVNGGVSLDTVQVIVNSNSFHTPPTVTAGSNPQVVLPSNSITITSTATFQGTLPTIKWTKFPTTSIGKVIVIGSSTMVGNNATTEDSTCIGMLRAYLLSLGAVDSVVNIALGGTDLGAGLPDGTTPPSGLSVPDPTRNVSEAKRRNGKVVLIGFPTNGFDNPAVTATIYRQTCQTIYNYAIANGMDCYIITTQAREEYSQAVEDKLKSFADTLVNFFGDHAIDFYHPIVIPGTTKKYAIYAESDSIHTNNAGHKIFYNVLRASNILQNQVSNSTAISTPNSLTTTITGLNSTGTYRYSIGVKDGDRLGASSISTVVVVPSINTCVGNKFVVLPDAVDSSVFYDGSSKQPGDSIFLNDNNKAFSTAQFSNLHGLPNCPIVIINDPALGRAVRFRGFNSLTGLGAQLKLFDCTNVKVTGSGIPAIFYGFDMDAFPGPWTLANKAGGNFGYAINGRSRKIEMERLYSRHAGIGFEIKEDGGCDDNYNFPNWIMDSIIVHDCKIQASADEGMYIGNTSPDNGPFSYDIRPVPCPDVNPTVITYPRPIRMGYVHVYNMITDSTGRGGIQIASGNGSAMEIDHNWVRHAGMNGDEQQGTGISCGTYTWPNIHDNTIDTTYTYGIGVLGGGFTDHQIRIENNIIRGAGYLRTYNSDLTINSTLLPWPMPVHIHTSPVDSLPALDSTQFGIKNNTFTGFQNSQFAIELADGWGRFQHSGNIICGNNIQTVSNNEGTNSINVTVTTVCAGASNIPPNANAGNDQTIQLPTNIASLNGLSSSDQDGTIATYFWRKITGTGGSISNTASPTPNVSGLTAGSYTYELTVTDNLGATDLDTVQVTVLAANIPPVARAGNDQSIQLPVNTVTVSGSSSSDADGTIVGYSWSNISGPVTFSIATPSAASTVINNLVAGVYQFTLTVTDNAGATAKDTVQVTVLAANIPPVAHAGSDQTIKLPISTITANGSTSTDADGTIATYGWAKISGPASGTIQSPASASTVINGYTLAGTYVYRLTVTDNLGATATDDIIITVNAANILPVANAGVDVGVTLPTTTSTLDGRLSSDADGTIAYAWTQISGTAATITSATSALTGVTGLTTAGARVFRLTVTDNDGGVATDDVTITVTATNIFPVAVAGSYQLVLLPANQVTLSASQSFDPDGTIVSYLWTKKEGPSCTIVTPTGASTIVNGLTAGVYKFDLAVTDNNGAVSHGEVVIVVGSIASIRVGRFGGLRAVVN